MPKRIAPLTDTKVRTDRLTEAALLSWSMTKSCANGRPKRLRLCNHKGVIAKARPAASAICPGREHECVMPVHTVPAAARSAVSFIVCDKRSDINRVPVSAGRLIQWQCNAYLVCGFIATCLRLRRSDRQMANANQWEIGVATGNKRSQMLCLHANGELTLVIGGNRVPLAELIAFCDGQYSLDGAMICRMVDAAAHSRRPLHAKPGQERGPQAGDPGKCMQAGRKNIVN